MSSRQWNNYPAQCYIYIKQTKTVTNLNYLRSKESFFEYLWVIELNKVGVIQFKKKNRKGFIINFITPDQIWSSHYIQRMIIPYYLYLYHFWLFVNKILNNWHSQFCFYFACILKPVLHPNRVILKLYLWLYVTKSTLSVITNI